MKERTSSVDTLFVVVLFCAFTASVLLVLLLGARVYGAMTKTAAQTFDRRTCAAYVTEKLRHGDSTGAVETGVFDGCSALYLTTDANGMAYSDILYYYNGWLWELNCEKSASFTRTDGVQVVEAGTVVFSGPTDGVVTAAITDMDGQEQGVTYRLRSGGAQ